MQALTLGSAFSLQDWYPALLCLASGLLSVLYLVLMDASRTLKKKYGGRVPVSRILKAAFSFWKTAQIEESREYMKERLEELRKHSESRSGYVRSSTVLWFAFACAALVGYGISRIPRYSTETHHNVRVETRVSGNEWWMCDDEQGCYLYTGCKDFPNERVIWAGYVARMARWEERGDCKSIRAVGLGFFWERDAQYNVKEIQQ